MIEAHLIDRFVFSLVAFESLSHYRDHVRYVIKISRKCFMLEMGNKNGKKSAEVGRVCYTVSLFDFLSRFYFGRRHEVNGSS